MPSIGTKARMEKLSTRLSYSAWLVAQWTPEPRQAAARTGDRRDEFHSIFADRRRRLSRIYRRDTETLPHSFVDKRLSVDGARQMHMQIGPLGNGFRKAYNSGIP